MSNLKLPNPLQLVYFFAENFSSLFIYFSEEEKRIEILEVIQSEK